MKLSFREVGDPKGPPVVLIHAFPLSSAMWEPQFMLDWLKGIQGNPRPGTPEDIAGLAVFLSGPGAAYITGQVIPVDGGYSTTAVWPFEP